MSSDLRFIVVFFVDFAWFFAIIGMLLVMFGEWLRREECVLFVWWVVAGDFMPGG